jgi:hypothetical protein
METRDYQSVQRLQNSARWGVSVTNLRKNENNPLIALQDGEGQSKWLKGIRISELSHQANFWFARTLLRGGMKLL